MPLNYNDRELEVIVETTPGTAETPVWDGSASKFRVMDMRFVPEFEFNTRPVQRKGGSKLRRIREGAPCRVSFRLEQRRSATTATPDAWGSLLRACGYAETITASTSVGYKPNSDKTLHKTLTMVLGVDGIRHQLRGCAGNVNWVFEAGKGAFWEFEFFGVYVGTVDDGLNSITHEAALPPSWESASFTYGGSAIVIAGLTVRSGNRVVKRRDANAAYGMRNYHVTGRDMTAEVLVEATLVAGTDFYGDMDGETLRALAWQLGGSNMAYSIPKGQIVKIDEQDDEGTLMFALTMDLIENSEAGGDEFSFTVT